VSPKERIHEAKGHPNQWLGDLHVLPQEGFYPGGHESEMMMRECTFVETFVAVGPFLFYSIQFISI